MPKPQDDVQDLPGGYRMTELGPLPEEWRVVKLGEVADLKLGRTPPRKQRRFWNPGQFYWVSIADLNNGVITTTKEKVSKSARDEVFKHDPLPVGTLLLSFKLTIGKVGILGIPAYHNEAIVSVTPSSSMDKLFAFFMLQSLNYERDEDAYVKGKTLSKKKLQRLPIPLPPLPEQRAIAHVLRAVQEAREATERVIAALRDLKRSLMRHLFTYGPVPVDAVDQVALQDTLIGPIPAHWRLTKLGEVAEKPQYGYTSSAVHEPVGPKFLRITDIQNDRVQWASVPYCVIEGDLLDKYRLRRGDILFARIGATTGKTYLISKCPQAVFASYLIRIRTDTSQLLPEYLYFFTHTPQYWQQINAAKGGRLKQGINIPILTTLNVPLPPLSEQSEIARMLQTVDRKIEAEEARKEALEGLFKTLLHHLMTAKIRLPADFIVRFEEVSNHE